MPGPGLFGRLGAALTALGVVLVATLLALPARAAEPSELAVTAPAAYAGQDTTLTLRLSSGGEPRAGATLTLARRVDGEWQPLGTVVTDETGTATRAVTLRRDPADNRVRAAFAGDEAHDPAATSYDLRLRKRDGRVRLAGPDSFVDETSARLEVSWRTGSGEPVGGRVLLQIRRGGTWRTYDALRTGADGTAARRVSPRKDTKWRARASGLPWVTGDISDVHRLDNLPPGDPVRLPSAAPRPRRKVPVQDHAVGRGPNPVITRIPDGVWRHMTGITWHRGCPVGRAGLRLLRINYWDYTGYRRRGELVAAAGAVDNMARALSDLYAAGLPIRSMYRVDRFGWSSRLRGGDDYASMAAGNTSAFNCRDVVGRPGVRSPHSYGRSLDINPWENPYLSSHGWVPNAWWPSRSHPRVAWRSRAHQVVRIMADNGLRWTYGVRDAHHFDVAGRNGRVLVVPGCDDGEVCH